MIFKRLIYRNLKKDYGLEHFNSFSLTVCIPALIELFLQKALQNSPGLSSMKEDVSWCFFEMRVILE